MPRNTRALERRAAAKAARAAVMNTPSVRMPAVSPSAPTANAAQLQRRLDAAQARQGELSDALKPRVSVGERAQTDLIAVTLGTSFHESLNFFIRWAAEASRRDEGDASFWYRNVDLLQALPGALGLATYLVNTLLLHTTEAALRSEQRIYLPPGWRIGLNESAKLLTTLGLSHVFRALRYRWADSVDEQRTTSEILAEQRATLEKARDEIARLNERLRQLQLQGKPS